MNEDVVDEIKQVTLGSLRGTEFTDVIAKALEPHSVVIFYAINDPKGDGGSGTLVHYKGIKGILTASHVIAPLKDKQYIYLPCILRPGTAGVWEVVGVPMYRIHTIDDLNLYLLPEWIQNWSENGLDISLVQLEDNIFEDIVKLWGKQPIDLAEMRQKYLGQEVQYWSPVHKHDWTWVIAGTPREGCGLIEKDVNCFPHAGVYLGGGETKLRVDTLQLVQSPYMGKEVDIIETQIGPTQDILPRNFAGCSGGGMYQTRERQIGDRFKMEEVLLAGVVVAGNEGKGRLYSRGHIALYDIFCDFLDRQLNKKMC
ncbi:hypothetical protein [Estrella lausannensis]|uniref:Serine protease n=1 Tax=Estrella lausannensis TaxID=483423 RepID=A0A0H5DSN9_9BACT|nr:hypothetical protein [Estrella lausannensis]CRX38809.1 hypothetical protein ELAC_1476 [Estrella lausannensis]